MSITTYAELQTAAANWLNRTNLTPRIPEFISLAEARIHRDLRIRRMEAIATSTVSANPIDLDSSPFTRFVKLRSLSIVVGGATYILNYVSPDVYQATFNDVSSGVPEFYTIIGTGLYLDPAPNDTYTYTAYYYGTPIALSATDTTNWLLTYHPDVYLYATLLAAQPYLKMDEIQTYKALYDDAVGSLNRRDIRDRQSGTSRVISEVRSV